MNSELRPHQVKAIAMLRLPGEEFRTVEWAPRYLVSDLGRVFSTIRSGRLLRQTISPQGYPYVSLMGSGGKPQKVLVHRLVAEAFLPRVSGLDVVNHRNGVKTDNRAQNLEWCTYGDNNQHAKDTGLSQAFGQTHYAALLTESDVREIRRLVSYGEMHKTVAAQFGIARQTVTKIANRQAWRALG